MPLKRTANLLLDCYRFYLAAVQESTAAAILAAAESISDSSADRPAEGMLTIADAARRLNVSQPTIRRMIDDGRLSPSRLGRGSIRFTAA